MKNVGHVSIKELNDQDSDEDIFLKDTNTGNDSKWLKYINEKFYLSSIKQEHIEDFLLRQESKTMYSVPGFTDKNLEIGSDELLNEEDSSAIRRERSSSIALKTIQDNISDFDLHSNDDVSIYNHENDLMPSKTYLEMMIGPNGAANNIGALTNQI